MLDVCADRREGGLEVEYHRGCFAPVADGGDLRAVLLRWLDNGEPHCLAALVRLKWIKNS